MAKIDNSHFWPDYVEKEKVWGLIDCSEGINCLEALFYMVAILTLFVVVIITTTIYIVIFLAKQNISRSPHRNNSLAKILRRKKRQCASSHFIQSYADNINLRAAKSLLQNEIEWAVTRDAFTVDQKTHTIREEADLDLSHSPKAWELHKKRGFQYQKEEIKRVKQFSVLNEVPKFSYADPNEILAKYRENNPPIYMAYTNNYANSRLNYPLEANDSSEDKISVITVDSDLMATNNNTNNTFTKAVDTTKGDNVNQPIQATNETYGTNDVLVNTNTNTKQPLSTLKSQKSMKSAKSISFSNGFLVEKK